MKHTVLFLSCHMFESDNNPPSNWLKNRLNFKTVTFNLQVYYSIPNFVGKILYCVLDDKRHLIILKIRSYDFIQLSCVHCRSTLSKVYGLHTDQNTILACDFSGINTINFKYSQFEIVNSTKLALLVLFKIPYMLVHCIFPYL